MFCIAVHFLSSLLGSVNQCTYFQYTLQYEKHIQKEITDLNIEINKVKKVLISLCRGNVYSYKEKEDILDEFVAEMDEIKRGN
jgi:hypothetical protein